MHVQNTQNGDSYSILQCVRSGWCAHCGADRPAPYKPILYSTVCSDIVAGESLYSFRFRGVRNPVYNLQSTYPCISYNRKVFFILLFLVVVALLSIVPFSEGISMKCSSQGFIAQYDVSFCGQNTATDDVLKLWWLMGESRFFRRKIICF